MRLRIAPGELVLALFFALLGALWIVAALRMPLWSGFVPQSGFMPLWYGIVLLGLAGAVLAFNREVKTEDPVRKPLVLLAVIAATILGLKLAGYVVSIFLLLLALFAAVDRLPLARSVAVAAAATAVLYLVFKTWLGVPLP
ncbi:MAG TPA: tripartite tricarboxylate transporter TctB family protein [Burkholderiales bacterium]|nr:tripartite tricarboxylate transporter TctB family protein [Burkholderiales bacterium]